MSEREKLKKGLVNTFGVKADGKTRKLATLDNLCDFILKDRKHQEIKNLCWVFPDLNSKSGITIQKGSIKDFALQRKIQLERELGVSHE